MSTMRAVVVDPENKGRLALREVTLPSPASSEALVRVFATSLNLGEVRAAVLRPQGARWRPGWDLAGVVEQEAGDGSGPAVGTRVFGAVQAGSWAEFVAVPTTHEEQLFGFEIAQLQEKIELNRGVCKGCEEVFLWLG